MPRSFHVADLNTRGELELEQPYQYQQLEQIPGAIELITRFATDVWRSPEEFEISLPGNRLTLRWVATAKSCGMATVRDEEGLLSLSLLVSGLEPQADTSTLQAFQRHLLMELRDTPYEPAFELLSIAQRPLVATINFRSPLFPEDQLLVALADRCFGAAFFRYLDLA